MSFSVSGAAFVGIRPIGQGEPDDDYYPARITACVYFKGDKPDARRMTVRLPSGFEKLHFLHLPDVNLLNNGSDDEKKTQRGRIGAIRAVLESLGYTQADIENPNNNITEAWFVYNDSLGPTGAPINPREAHVGWCAGERNVKESYGDIVEWVTAERFAALKAAGTKPPRAGMSSNRNTNTKTPGGGPPVATSYTPPPAPPVAPGGFTPPVAPPAGVSTGGPPAPPPSAPPAAPAGGPPPPPPLPPGVSR